MVAGKVFRRLLQSEMRQQEGEVDDQDGSQWTRVRGLALASDASLRLVPTRPAHRRFPGTSRSVRAPGARRAQSPRLLPSRSADPCLLPGHGGYVRIGPVVQQEGEVDDQDGSQRTRVRGIALACKPAKLPSSFSLTFTNREVTSTDV